MKKVYILGLIITLITSGSLIGQNMVINGDFEDWTGSTADNWLADGGAVAITQNSTTTQSGSYSCEVLWTSQDNQYLTSDPFNVTAGIQINASLWAYDNDIAGRARLCVIYEGADNYFGDYTTDMDSWQQLTYTDLVPSGATSAEFQIRFYDISGDWDGDAMIIVDNIVYENNTTVNPEPTNYPTDFAAAPSGTKIMLTWTDAIGDQLPLSYVIMGNNNGSSFTPPVDGTPVEDDTNWDDGNIAMNVLYGVQTYSISVDANTDYTFTIYPFTNTGDIIDYKTDGTPPAASATSSNSVVVNQESFDSDLGSWTGFTVIGDQVWEWASYGVPPGCAKMNGFSGAAVANEDWLISPSLDLTSFESVSFSFDQARNYASNDGLYVLVSTDYDGSSDPSTNGIWNDITSSYTFPDPGSWDFMEAGVADVSAFTGVNTYFAFKYTSTDSDASTWEIDNALIYGITGIGIIESPKVNFSFYPNPGVDFVYVDADTEGAVKIYSISGQLLIDEPVNKGVNNIDIDALSQGTYLLQFSNAKGNSSTKKLIVR